MLCTLRPDRTCVFIFSVLCVLPFLTFFVLFILALYYSPTESKMLSKSAYSINGTLSWYCSLWNFSLFFFSFLATSYKSYLMLTRTYYSLCVGALFNVCSAIFLQARLVFAATCARSALCKFADVSSSYSYLLQGFCLDFVGLWTNFVHSFIYTTSLTDFCRHFTHFSQSLLLTSWGIVSSL